jgi:lambda repressor-like predicted transcriptional regulator
MNKEITINFGDIISELKEKNLKLCFIKNQGLFIQDSLNNLYQMESYRQGSYLDKLIKNAITVEFDYVDTLISQNINDFEKEIWCISDVRDFMKRQKF